MSNSIRKRNRLAQIRSGMNDAYLALAAVAVRVRDYDEVDVHELRRVAAELGRLSLLADAPEVEAPTATPFRPRARTTVPERVRLRIVR